MTDSAAGRRGQPLVVLIGLLVSWVGMRVVLWQPPFEMMAGSHFFTEPAMADRAGSARPKAVEARNGTAADSPPPAQPADGSAVPGPWRTLDRPLPGLIPAPLPGTQLSVRSRVAAWAVPYASSQTGAASAAMASELSPPRMAVGHAVLAMMGLSRMEVPAAIAAYVDLARRPEGGSVLRPTPGAAQAAREPVGPGPDLGLGLGLGAASGPGQRRWSGDAWLLLRKGGVAPFAAGQPSYGRSQAGAVLRYRLAPSSSHRPQAYVRASAALERPRYAEMAGGVSARPLPNVPLRFAAELRVADGAGGTDLRPAAFAVTEFPPLEMPLGARGEAYFQGGYVGGDFATPFIDGQLRVTREVARVGGSGLSAGAGVWGGAQENASRLDIGPTAAISFRLGQVNSRLAVDYRLRVAGDAEPESGPALTLSAGF